jgi:hypothetical protein
MQPADTEAGEGLAEEQAAHKMASVAKRTGWVPFYESPAFAALPSSGTDQDTSPKRKRGKQFSLACASGL